MTEVKDEIIDSAKNDETVEKTTDTEADKKAEVEKNKADEKTIPNYRPIDDKTPKNETVPLKKYLDLKNEIKELRQSGDKSSSNLTLKELEDLAEEHNVDKTFVQKIANIIKNETLKEADKKIAPILEKERIRESEKAFDKDFKRSILEKYPELKEKRDAFKKIAFSPQFLHLKTLDDIRKEFFDGYKFKGEVKKDTVEGGSQGGNKGSETVDFTTLHKNPELHAKVLADPKLRTEYYKWKDTQV